MSKDQEAIEFSLVVVSPDEVIFEGPAVKVSVPGITQELAILPDHTPLYSQLTRGSVTINSPSGQLRSINIEGGIIRVRSNQVTIITGFDIRDDQVNASY